MTINSTIGFSTSGSIRFFVLEKVYGQVDYHSCSMCMKYILKNAKFHGSSQRKNNGQMVLSIWIEHATILRDKTLNKDMKNTFSCLATSLAEDPETSIHVFENKAHADSINTI